LKVSLFPISDPTRSVEIPLSKLKEPAALEGLERWLEGRLRGLVDGFGHFLEGLKKEFEKRILQLKRLNSEIEFGKIVVLKAGNASKNKIVSQLLEEKFAGKGWELREIFDVEMGVTPKNGVAKGHNWLEMVKVVKHFQGGRGKFQFQVNLWSWRELKRGKRAKPVIPQGKGENFPFQWVGLVKREERTIQLYYSEMPAVTGHQDPHLQRKEFKIPEGVGNGLSLWVRPAGEYLLECKLGNKTEANLGNPSFYIDLKKGQVISKKGEK
jgi:hypothetical protein